jgi:phosphohistidine phosphatase
MAELGLAPDLVLVSPARRTVQTLETLEPWDETPLTDQVESLYLATPAQMIGLLRNVAETVRSVLLIGHNPGLHELAITLLGPARSTDTARQLVEKYPTCALAEFMIPGPWLRLGPGGGQLMRFVTPRGIA